MRHVTVSALLVLQLCGSALAFDDAAVCNTLRNVGASGLYLAYPNFSSAMAKPGGQGTCDGAGGFCLSKVVRVHPFDDNARFYYVPAAIPRSEEGVWHIRTQTKARNLVGADQAYLARPAINTRCSPTRLLESFANGAAYVPVSDYIDHHAGISMENIGTKFHFEIKDQPSTACIRTDDRRVFGDLSRVYGFHDVARKQKRVSRFLSVPGSAVASTPYAGLSSEFAYYDRTELPCFGFAAPKPTRTEYLGQSVDWKPYLTTIWIKQLRGREVTNVGGASLSVSWTE